MVRVSFSIDPMLAMRAAKIQAVNERFNRIAADNLHRDRAHAMKRQWAVSCQDSRLQSEADLRGISVAALSAVILSKPDNEAAREVERQRLMSRIDLAAVPTDFDSI